MSDVSDLRRKKAITAALIDIGDSLISLSLAEKRIERIDRLNVLLAERHKLTEFRCDLQILRDTLREVLR